MAKITRKTCFITGCSESGVGAALAEAFHDHGYHVFVTARMTSKVPQAFHTAPNVTVLALDVTSTESINAAAATVRDLTGGRLDILINNAGRGLNMPALDVSILEAKKLFDSNFFGVLQTIQAFQHMLVNARGVIVNNASMGGYLPIPFITIYQASKAALIAAGEGWRLELAPLDVRVVTLVTGGVATKFLANIEPVSMPGDSYYKSIKDIIEKQEVHVPLGVAPEKYALDVLRYVERGGTGKIWIGGGSLIGRVANWLFPTWALDMASMSMKPFAKKLAENHASSCAEGKTKSG